MQSQITSLKQLLARPIDGNLLLDKCNLWKDQIKSVKDYMGKMAISTDSFTNDIVEYPQLEKIQFIPRQDER